MDDILQFEPIGNKLIARRLKEGREAKGLNQTELADAVKVTPQAISQFESPTSQKQPE